MSESPAELKETELEIENRECNKKTKERERGREGGGQGGDEKAEGEWRNSR